MNIIKKINLLLITGVLISVMSSTLHPQELDSLIAEGLKNNPGIGSLEKNISAAGYRGESTGYLPPPSLGIEFAQVPFEDANPFTKALSQNLILSQMFMPGGKLGAMRKAEMKQADIIRTDLEVYKLNLVESIRKTYYDIWMMEHHVGLMEANIELLENIISSTEQLYQNNRAAYSDMLLLRAEVSARRSEIEVMENDLQSMYYMMNSLLGREDRNTEIIVKHNWKPDTTAVKTAFLEEQLLERNPSLLKMNEMEEMNRLEISANNKELIPDIMLQGMVMRMPQGMLLTTKTPVHMLDGMGETEYMYSIMASVTLPFAPWSSGKIKAKEEELLASIEGINEERRNMKLMLKTEFYSLINSVQSARREMRLLNDEVIPLYRQTIESQLIELQNNRNSIVNIIQTINMLLMKEEELAEVVTKHQKILSEIETITAAGSGSLIYEGN